VTDFASYQNLDFAFAQLLADLSKTWAMRDVAYIQDIVSHAEYADALENLIAIGQGNGRSFSPDHLGRIAELSKIMGIDAPSVPNRTGGNAKAFPKSSVARPSPR